MRAPARALAARRFDLRRAALHDLPLKLAALAVAVGLWTVVAESAAREATVTLAGRVAVERPDAPAGYVLRGALGDVAVRLRGPEALVMKVTAAELRASVDLAPADLASGGPVELPVRVTPADPRIRVVDVTPAAVSVRVERLTARTLTVQARFANEPARGWVAETALIRPKDVRVSGPESVVASVAAVVVTVRFGDAPLDVVQTAQPVPVDAAGAPLDGLSAEPATIEVGVAVRPTATTRTVAVAPVFRGAPTTGYWLRGISAAPVAVTVRGAPAALAALDRVETSTVDASGLTSDRTVRVGLALPEGIALVRPEDVSVTLSVGVLTGSRAFPQLAVQALNVPPGLVAELEPRSVEVVLAGPLPALGAADAVLATVDAAGRGVGTHLAEVTIRGPQGLTTQSVQPGRVTLTIHGR